MSEDPWEKAEEEVLSDWPGVGKGQPEPGSRTMPDTGRIDEGTQHQVAPLLYC